MNEQYDELENAGDISIESTPPETREISVKNASPALIIFLIVFIILYITGVPLLTLWAINTLFCTAIPYTLSNWAATLTLMVALKSNYNLPKFK